MRPAFLFSMLLLSSSMTASAVGVEYLGNIRFSSVASAEQADVESCGRLQERVLKIKFRARGSDLDFYSIRLEFVGGNYQVIPGIDHLAESSATDWISIKGGSQCLKNVQITGQSRSLNGALDIYGITLDYNNLP